MKYRINYDNLERLVISTGEMADIEAHVRNFYLRTKKGQRALLQKWQSLFGSWVTLDQAFEFEKRSQCAHLYFKKGE